MLLGSLLRVSGPWNMKFCLFSPGASIPPNTLEQVPLPFPFPSLPLPLEVGPLNLRLGGLGERFSFPSGSGQSPAAKRYLVNFRLKISPLVATIFRSFSEINHSVFAET